MASLRPSIPVSLRLRTSVANRCRSGRSAGTSAGARRRTARLLAAGSGADLEDDVAVVVRVAWQKEDLELVEQLRLLDFESRDLLAGQRAHVVVGLAHLAQLTGTRQLVAGRQEAAERRDGRLETGELLTESADLVGVGG